MEEEEGRQSDEDRCYLEKVLGIFDDDDADVEQFQISEEAVAEMMRQLQDEIGLGGSRSPSPSQVTSFVTINGNEESCGSSFSGPASTVMASIDTRGVACASCFIGGPSDRAPLFWPWPMSSVEDVGYWPAPAGATTAANEEIVRTAGATTAANEEIVLTAGAANDEDEDDWLARALDDPGFDFESLLQ